MEDLLTKAERQHGEAVEPSSLGLPVHSEASRERQREAFQNLVHDLQNSPSSATLENLMQCAQEVDKGLWAEAIAQVTVSSSLVFVVAS